MARGAVKRLAVFHKVLHIFWSLVIIQPIHHENMPIKFGPLKPHFYIVKLGLQGYTLFFLFLLENIDCGYSLEPPRPGGTNEYHNLCFEQKCEKTSEFLS